MSAVDAGVGVGFFGKVRSHGDFVTRRLPVSFTRSWDDWLQTGLQASREALGPDWLLTYLNSPIWRFALAPGACDAQAWAGVLMPSVDRVGRQFPLTLAARVASASGAAPLLGWMAQAGGWYDPLETLALSTLSDEFSLDAFDATLRLLAAPPGGDERTVFAAPVRGHVLPLAGLAQPGAAMPALTEALANVLLAGHSMWWTEGSQLVPPCVLVHRGLPVAGSFTALLDGQWQLHGWRQPG